MGNFHSLYCAYNTLSCIMKIRINGNENGHKAVERKRSIYEKNNFRRKIRIESKRSQKGAKNGADRKIDILYQMEENPEVTQVKLMEGFDLSRKQIQRLIKDMREEGLVERRGSNRNGKWIAKK